MLGVAFIVFTLLYLTPGDPARIVLGEQGYRRCTRRVSREGGTERPLPRPVRQLRLEGRYPGRYRPLLHDAPFRGHEIMSAFPSTLKLALSCVIAAVLLGIPIGILSAIRQNTLFDNVTRFLAIVGLSMPVFWQGVLLILLFSVKLRWFPASGFDTWATLVLPTLTLACNPLAVITRMTRSSMLEVVRQDYIRTARAKGQTEQIVIWRHALGNALIPIVTVIGLQFGSLLAGAVAHRIHLLHPRRWTAHGGCHQDAGLPGRSGRRPVHRRRVQLRESHGRPPLRLDRPENQSAVQVGEERK